MSNTPSAKKRHTHTGDQKVTATSNPSYPSSYTSPSTPSFSQASIHQYPYGAQTAGYDQGYYQGQQAVGYEYGQAAGAYGGGYPGGYGGAVGRTGAGGYGGPGPASAYPPPTPNYSAPYPQAPLGQQGNYPGAFPTPGTPPVPPTPGSVPPPSTSTAAKLPKKQVTVIRRAAGGEVWDDPTLLEWDPNDFRLFCGDLGHEVTDEVLARAFRRYPSFQKAKVVMDKRNAKSRGFGFVSFKEPSDYASAFREMQGKYVGNRPIKLRKSNWQDRSLVLRKRKEKEEGRKPMPQWATQTSAAKAKRRAKRGQGSRGGSGSGEVLGELPR